MHARFKESLLARLSAAELPALAGLGTREDADFTIALCDALAVTLDVLTFYQERIANENFLRTATERRSILELARLIGYELAPGVAAGTHLAFTLAGGAGPPAAAAAPVTIAAGTRVQSVPGPDEQPQTFETVEAVEARVEWNAIPVQTDARMASARRATACSTSPASATTCSRAMRSSSSARSGSTTRAASAGTSASLTAVDARRERAAHARRAGHTASAA